MKKLILSLLLLIPSLSFADTLTTSEPHLILISTGSVDRTRSWGDKVNYNFSVIASSLSTALSGAGGGQSSFAGSKATSALEMGGFSVNNSSGFTLGTNGKITFPDGTIQNTAASAGSFDEKSTHTLTGNYTFLADSTTVFNRLWVSKDNVNPLTVGSSDLGGINSSFNGSRIFSFANQNSGGSFSLRIMNDGTGSKYTDIVSNGKTSSLPGLTQFINTNDGNSKGFSFHGANQNDLPRFSISASSFNVGIGTANPSAYFEIHSTAAEMGLFNNNVLFKVSSGDTTSMFTIGYDSTTIWQNLRVNGKIGVSKNPVEALDITGNIGLTGRTYYSFGGSLAFPALSWTANNSPGIWSPGTDQIGFVTNSIERFAIQKDGNLVSSSTLNIASMTVYGTITSTTGFVGDGSKLYNLPGSTPFDQTKSYNFTAPQIFTATGTFTAPLTVASMTVFGTITTTSTIVASKIGILKTAGEAVDVLGNIQLSGRTYYTGGGSLTSPAIRFTSNGDAGIFSPGANKLQFVTNLSTAILIDQGIVNITSVAVFNSTVTFVAPINVASVTVYGTVTSTSGFVGGVSTFTAVYARSVKRITTVADATSISIDVSYVDVVHQSNTQAAGTLTINAPTGTYYDGQALLYRLKCTNVQTFSWNGIFRNASGSALPTATTGSGNTNYYAFTYNQLDNKWDYTGSN